ncbi:unnamed protein product [Xylocopa violacea]|uniref:Ferritin n=1 Tax=Xylocopa violacea TaxID=135666 RepID=A0ABP1P5V8_XYLVO
MLLFGILSILLAVTSAEECYSEMYSACQANSKTSVLDESVKDKCNATYGSIDGLLVDLQGYANVNIDSSFEFLLLSSYFGNYENQREGFKKLYRKYSDQMWEDAINLIKFITKRGGTMDFHKFSQFKTPIAEARIIELNEIESLAKALDIQKQIANEALRIHSRAQLHTKHDASVAHYVEERFLESQAERIRDLAGYITDLKHLLAEHDPTLCLFLFDEYLQKSL